MHARQCREVGCSSNVILARTRATHRFVLLEPVDELPPDLQDRSLRKFGLVAGVAVPVEQLRPCGRKLYVLHHQTCARARREQHQQAGR